jgi:acyl-CoA thioesterase I
MIDVNATDARPCIRRFGLWRNMVAAALVFNAAILVAGSAVRAESGAKSMKIVAFGDSLSAGYQLPPGDSFPAQLQKALIARGHKVEVINAGVSGDTTGAGLERIAWAVPPDADGVIVELGANDALRGLDPGKARANLDKILATLSQQKVALLVAGMRAPRNYQTDYTSAFDKMFPELAVKYDALLYPFFLERIALKAEFNLADGMHPNAKGVAEIVKDIMPKVEELIARIQARRAQAKG